jgi:hypothetical protein
LSVKDQNGNTPAIDPKFPASNHHHRFHLDKPTTLKIALEIVYNLPTIKGRGPIHHKLLTRAAKTFKIFNHEQEYEIDNNGLVKAKPNTKLSSLFPNPLFSMKTSSQTTTLCQVTIDTEYIEVTDWWAHIALNYTNWNRKSKVTQLTIDDHFQVIATTQGKPEVWFVSLSGKIKKHKNKIGCLVFFRPKGYSWKNLNQIHNQSPLNRYLLAPGMTTPELNMERDHIVPNANPQSADDIALYCDFETVMDRSNRVLAMFHPWPRITDFGTATRTDLHKKCRKMLQLLQAEKIIPLEKRSPSVTLGLAGFSQGGEALWKALRNNLSHVREVYAFDCQFGRVVKNKKGDAFKNIPDKHAPVDAASFVKLRTDNHLRLSAGANCVLSYNGLVEMLRVHYEKIAFDETNKINDSNKLSDSEKETMRSQITLEWLDNLARFSTTPKNHDEFTQTGKNALWDFVMQKNSRLRTNGNIWHQFAVFGGPPSTQGAAHPWQTYLLTFLDQSGFPR